MSELARRAEQPAVELDGVARRPDTELGSEVGAELLVHNDDLLTKVEQHVAEASGR